MKIRPAFCEKLQRVY